MTTQIADPAKEIRSRFGWTTGTIAASSALKFVQNVILARLLGPDVLGVLVIVNTVRLGIDLLTDVGIEQNIVHNPRGADRNFRDTAWTIQSLRGIVLTVIFVALAVPLARFYRLDPLIFLVAAAGPAIAALHSTAIFVMVKRLQVRQRSLFELGCEALSAMVVIGLVLVWPTIWAPVIGLVTASAIRASLSYLLPEPDQRIRLDRSDAQSILSFGKWVAISSLVMYGAANLDRLYLGRVSPLALLGVYGVARAIAELPVTLARRIAYQVIFPSLANEVHEPGSEASRTHTRLRLQFAIACCVALAAGSAIADLLIRPIYGHRYDDAGWMLSILLTGSVFSTLAHLNEATLVGLGKPQFVSLANLVRVATLAIGLVAGFSIYGFAGSVIAVALTEAANFFVIALLQRSLGVRRLFADLTVIGLAALTYCAVVGLRVAAGWGTPLALLMARH